MQVLTQLDDSTLFAQFRGVCHAVEDAIRQLPSQRLLVVARVGAVESDWNRGLQVLENQAESVVMKLGRFRAQVVPVLRIESTRQLCSICKHSLFERHSRAEYLLVVQRHMAAVSSGFAAARVTVWKSTSRQGGNHDNH